MDFSGISIKWNILFLVVLGPLVIAVSLAWQQNDAILSGAEKAILSKKSAGIVLMAEPKESGYTFRAPMVMPRNPQNIPDRS